MSNSVRDYEKLAVDIINAVGGKENIVKAARCATRLRLVLKETPKDAHKKVSELTGVITVVENNGQFQVVIGTHVGKVFDKVQTIVDLDDSSKDEAPKGTILNRVIATMSAVFAPFIYILAAAVIGGLWQIVVIFGVHWGVTPMCLANYDMYGMDTFQAFQTMVVVAQMGAAFGVFLKAKKMETKNVSLSAGITGIFGITEPAIYGVTLKYKKPFICGCVAGALGAVVASFFNVAYYAYAGLPGLLTVVNAINPENPTSIMGIAIGCAIAVIGSIILVQIVGFGEESEEVKEDIIKEVATTLLDNNKEIKNPLSGKVLPLSKVEDAVFSSGAMGNGIAIDLTDNKVYAPFDGTVEFIAETKHAIGLKSDDGVELLIHVGMDTVKMNGKGLDVKTKVNERVKEGDLLLEFDRNEIQKEGYSLITPVVITNSNNYEQDELCIDEEALFGKSIINLKSVEV